ncbi:hypothetical protein DF220_05120 [Salinibacterium hongtaonis]|uniref:DUF559 domain-containing protein n=2 Tax=Homoserinimonas hongtaonis TaxID=2079791 RepID=A0A2U1T089_9MICO|nr:hypothetical protein DF220_05120 [Salinibacterium hongtaonis]
MGDGRLRSSDLASPFHGVRVSADIEPSLSIRLQAYQQRMPSHQHYSHTTAALIHGIPLPLSAERDTRLHVSAARGAGFPRARGVVGHHSGTVTRLVRVAGYLVSSPVTAWCELACILPLDDLVAAGDFLITGNEPIFGYPPLSDAAQLSDALAARSGHRGIRTLAEALRLVRYGAVSRMETLTRLLIVRGGLPEPALNYEVPGAHGAIVDLAYAQQRVAVEYQGDIHRERDRFRRDITRRERLEDCGWTVIYVSTDDIVRYPRETVARIRTRLAARGWA